MVTYQAVSPGLSLFSIGSISTLLSDAVANISSFFGSTPPELVVTSGINIDPAGPYRVGQTLTAEFTVQKNGSSEIKVERLLVGGRLGSADDCAATNRPCPDFSIDPNVTIGAKAFHRYRGTFTPTEPGNYSFEVYYLRNGDWHLNLGTDGGANPVFINVVASEVAFYYPTVGTPPYGSFANWHAGCRGLDGCESRLSYGGGGFYHLAQGMPAEAKEPVYAFTDGEIVYVSVNGWGVDNYGLIIKHRDTDGSTFYALYGHIRPNDPNLRGDKSGSVTPVKVDAGKSFAKIGPLDENPHLHFGILPNNELPIVRDGCFRWGFRPHGCWGDPLEAQDDGFVNPLRWIEDRNPIAQTGILLPDLTISAAVNNSYKSGQREVQIPVTVSRTGGSIIEGTYVLARLFWSRDRVLDSLDMQLWQSDGSKDFLNALLNGGSRTSMSATATVNIPTVRGTGTYYIIAFADANKFQSESDETNNTRAFEVRIAAPDYTLTTAANPSN